MSFARNSSIDTTIYEGAPGTLYTDSTTLVFGMTLYNNEGIDSGYKVGEILENANGFRLYNSNITYLNVEDYLYVRTEEDMLVSLAFFINSDKENVVTPELEEL